MKLLIFLSCLITVQAEFRSSCVTFNNSYFIEEELVNNMDRPYSLAVDKKTNDLYFSHSLDPNSTATESIRFNLAEHYFQWIENISGYSHATDRVNTTGVIYIGSYAKIYKLSEPEYDPIEIISVPGDWISDMYYLNIGILLYTTYPEGKMFMYNISSGESGEVKQFTNSHAIHFVFDDNPIPIAYFSNSTGLYSMNNKGEAILYKNVVKNDVRGLALDNYGTVYTCLRDGLYIFDTTNKSLKKLYDIYEAFGITFDNNNNIIYSTATSLMRLVVVSEEECMKE